MEMLGSQISELSSLLAWDRGLANGVEAAVESVAAGERSVTGLKERVGEAESETHVSLKE